MSSPYPVPFFPPQVQQQQQQVVPDPEEPICTGCGELFKEGEEAVELFHGYMGRGKKSGRWMVLESEAHADEGPIQLHPWCVRAFSAEFICEEEEDPEPLCVACESKLSGDD